MHSNNLLSLLVRHSIRNYKCRLPVKNKYILTKMFAFWFIFVVGIKIWINFMDD